MCIVIRREITLHCRHFIQTAFNYKRYKNKADTKKTKQMHDNITLLYTVGIIYYLISNMSS